LAALVGWILLTPEIPDQVGDDPSLPALTGYLYEVGAITDFIDIPNNPCIEVDTETGAVMIPLHEDFILSVDPDNQEIIMLIPEGLI
jgi:ribosomal 30S subunit maturation factor RimM